ncbi:MAG TPA: acylglycerol kinase family protein, partial [Clostridiales bacterium]|nr:acylglycerol kinase family protein [Clostridiales bacterium]
MKRKVLLIINPMAGKKKSQPATFEIVEKFSHIGYDFTVKTTTCPGDATNIVKKFGEGFDLVVCCGGDGTLNETINGVMALPCRLPVGYIPTGSTNDLAATLGIPPNIRKATQIILSRSANMLDLGLFNTRYFCYVASF